ncbi:MAG: hypothetical protein MJY58_03635 [Bacteroidaceae bacterium]|nr:hypothetical protein [Bacteroidaceae bacterium]
MKLKTIITAVAAIAVAGIVTSCEDMLKVDSKMVMYDYENNIDNPSDTVYSVMGIVSGLQKIADRTVLINELRGDLVRLTDKAAKKLSDIYNYRFDQLDDNNNLANAADYYAIINNCNFYLAKADTAKVRNGKYVFLDEYVAVLSYRAWTYLQLAQVYGKVKFVNKPILSSDVSANQFEEMDIKQLADTLLQDFEDRFLNVPLPDYGSLGGETSGDGTETSTHETRDMFIPVRVIMGDLYLWAEDYVNAAKMYFDYLYNVKGSERPTTTANVSWFETKFIDLADNDDSYSGLFGNNMKSDNFIAYIPMEYDDYNGTVSELPIIFNSDKKKNNNWYQLSYSKYLAWLSSEKYNYCYHTFDKQSQNVKQKAVYPNKLDQANILRRGDLRLQSVLKIKNVDVDDEVANVSNEQQTLAKINAEKISIYRNDVIYLRLAEALNRCGLPQTAFAILKYGLSYDVVNDESYIDVDEMVKAYNLGLGSIFDISSASFRKGQLTAKDDSRTFSDLSYSMYYSYYASTDLYNTIGIHSRGCGDASYDTTYVIPALPTLTDSIRKVEEFIIDEMALETCFEGYRFGDLMRISMHRAAEDGGFADNAFLAERVAARESADGTYSSSPLYYELLGDGTSYNEKWFLELK